MKIMPLEEDRTGLERWLKSRAVGDKQRLRARMVLMTADGLPTKAIMATLGVSNPTLNKWRARYLESGVEGLKKGKARPSRIPPLSTDKVQEVLALTLTGKPVAATHWSCRTMAQQVGISRMAVHGIWREHKLKPHQVRGSKVSNDPLFAEKLRDAVGLYLGPPEKAIAFSVDEKSQIQALGRSQPGLPMKPGKCGAMTHDYKRHGTTTLFAALDVHTGAVIGQCQPRHRHDEFLKFLKAIDRRTDKALALHLIVDNDATHKHAEVKDWLARHPRFHLHFTPTSASWVNLVERFFRDITEERIRRGVFHSVDDLKTAIKDYLDHRNSNPKPYHWTAKPETILAKVDKAKYMLRTLH